MQSTPNSNFLGM
uniref:Uncharacterized protein n=1 Tax=Lepeophtheirus salmonis TaxID=72036 RepID=A0A0K2V5Y7_LEPSM